MNAVILATAILLQTPGADTSDPGRATTTAPHAEVVMTRPARVRVPAATLGVGEDKAQHFFMSYALASFTYGSGRAAGLDREAALYGAMGGTLAAGAVKELVDARSGGDPSFADFLADLLGAAAAYVMLRQVR